MSDRRIPEGAAEGKSGPGWLDEPPWTPERWARFEAAAKAGDHGVITAAWTTVGDWRPWMDGQEVDDGE